MHKSRELIGEGRGGIPLTPPAGPNGVGSQLTGATLWKGQREHVERCLHQAILIGTEGMVRGTGMEERGHETIGGIRVGETRHPVAAAATISISTSTPFDPVLGAVLGGLPTSLAQQETYEKNFFFRHPDQSSKEFFVTGPSGYHRHRHGCGPEPGTRTHCHPGTCHGGTGGRDQDCDACGGPLQDT
jgi:hypothetical protein